MYEGNSGCVRKHWSTIININNSTSFYAQEVHNRSENDSVIDVRMYDYIEVVKVLITTGSEFYLVIKF